MKVVIIGGGQAGSYIANMLIEHKHKVVVIENRDSSFKKLKNRLPEECLLFGNGANPGIMEDAGIADADVVAAVTGSDETNLVAATIAKFEFDIPRVIARVNNPKNAWLFTSEMGVDFALNQAALIAQLVVEEMNLDAMLMLMKVGRGSYSIVQFTVNSHSGVNGKCIKDIAFPKDSSIVAITNAGVVTIPNGNVQLTDGDEVLIFAANAVFQELEKMFA